MFTVRSTLIWALLTGPTDWVCHIVTLTLCVEAVAYSCIIVTWWSGSGGIQAWSRRPTGFLQYFDTVGLVIWPVKIVPEMTCNVLSGTLSLYTTTTTTQCHHMVTLWMFNTIKARPTIFNFRHSDTLVLNPVLSARVPKCQKLKMVGLAFKVKCNNLRSWVLKG